MADPRTSDNAPHNGESPGENFNSLGARFRSNIYGTMKGQLRLALLEDDFKQHILPALPADHARVLDLGCGEARMSLPLIAQGAALTLVDHSDDMLQHAKQHAEAQSLDLSRLQIVCAPAQQACETLTDHYDLVVIHALLEWVDAPLAVLQQCLTKVRPGGMLSLAFYNKNALVYRNLLQGNFRKIKKDDWQQRKGGLTPKHPLDPDEVLETLRCQHMEIVSQQGIRTFYDFMPKHRRESRSFDDVLEMERKVSRQEPYRSLGRYIHLVCRKDSQACGGA